jgi:hypothetical protein
MRVFDSRLNLKIRDARTKHPDKLQHRSWECQRSTAHSRHSVTPQHHDLDSNPTSRQYNWLLAVSDKTQIAKLHHRAAEGILECRIHTFPEPMNVSSMQYVPIIFEALRRTTYGLSAMGQPATASPNLQTWRVDRGEMVR